MVIKPEWRTPTIVALCKKMLDERNFDILPILADALEDVGCHDDSLLTPCRTKKLHHFAKERIVNIIYSNRTEESVKWLENFFAKWNFNGASQEYPGIVWDHESLKWVEDPKGPNPNSWEDCINQAIYERYLVANGIDLHGGEELGGDQDKFWTNLEIVTGEKISDSHKESYGWTCSC